MSRERGNSGHGSWVNLISISRVIILERKVINADGIVTELSGASRLGCAKIVCSGLSGAGRFGCPGIVCSGSLEQTAWTG